MNTAFRQLKSGTIGKLFSSSHLQGSTYQLLGSKQAFH